MPKQNNLHHLNWVAMLASGILSFLALAIILPLTAQGRPSAGITITPPASALSVDAGHAITHSFMVKNSIGVQEVFTLTATADRWLPQIEVNGVITDQLALFNGTSGDVALVVLVPSDVEPFLSDVATFTVTAHNDPSISATALLTTTRNTYQVVVTPSTATQPGAPGAAVTYTLHVTNTGNTSDTFDFTQSNSLLWPMALPASVGPLMANASTNTVVTVTIPVTAEGGLTGYTQITTTSQADSSQKVATLLTTTVNAVAGVELTQTAATQSASPGQTVTYTLYLSNTSNSTDSFTMTLAYNNWSASVAPTIASQVKKHTSVPLTVNAQIPGTALADERQVITLTATSWLSTSQQASAILTTTALSVYNFTLTTTMQAQMLGPGATAIYPVRLTNRGNVADVITLTVANNSWLTRINDNLTTSVSLGVGETRIVTLTVKIPFGEQEGSSNIATLTATSRGKPTLTAGLVFTTTSHTFKVYLPLILRNWPPPPPDWTRGTGAVSNETVYQIAACANQLYAGTRATGIFFSTDEGQSWTASNVGTGLVRGVAVNPQNCNEAYAFVQGQGVLKTINGGTTWSPATSGLGELFGYAVAVDTQNPQIIYAGMDALGVYKSIDSGGHWTKTNIPNSTVLGLSAIPGDVVYAATFGQGVYRLIGSIAEPLADANLPGTANVFAVAASSTTIFAAAETGLYRRTTGAGSTWQSVLSGKGRVFSVVIDSTTTPQTVWAGVESSGAWRSLDGGLTFTSYSQNLTGLAVRSVAVGATRLHAGTVASGAWWVTYP